MGTAALLLLTAAIATAANLPDSRTIFLSYQDVLRVPYKDWKSRSVVVSPGDVGSLGPLALDGDSVLVGGTNALLRLSATDLSTLGTLRWLPDERKAAYCKMNGQSEDECQNFIRTIVVREDETLVCGTHAFAPACQWVKSGDVSERIGESFDGVGLAPYSPNYQHSYVMTEEGGFYSGVATDFSAHDASFLRVLPKDRVLMSPKSGWLKEPTFLSAHEVGNFIFYFFRETATEMTACGSPEVGRVGRVCKNDIGGDVILDRTWTTFNKATLNCSSLRNLVSVSVDVKSGFVFAAFTSGEAELSSSAVCSYSLDSFRTAFGGDYLYQHGDTFTRHPNSYKYFNCGVKGASSGRPGQTEKSLVEAQKYQLMADIVQPLSNTPLSIGYLERYTHVVTDTVRMKHYGLVLVLFVVTREGLLKKVALLPEPVVAGQGKGSLSDPKVPCLIEVLRISDNDTLTIHDLKLHSGIGALFISSSAGVIKTPLQRCARFKTRQTCMDAMDPYCGWNSKTSECSGPPEGQTTHHYWHQDVASCPNTQFAVDGEYGEWTPWEACPLTSGVNSENCECRQRECDSPVPARGGAECKGPRIQVTNCTRHGEWSSWSTWSGCSATCGVAVKSRARSCTNPSPAYGGRICLGAETEQEYCPQPDCPVPVPTPIHGGWSLWSAWDPCSRKCGGGLTKRLRACNSPRPANDGNECPGCNLEYKECNTEPCEEIRRWSEWTDWLQANNSGLAVSKGVWVKRFKFACIVRTHDPSLLGVSAPRAEEKFCQKDTDDCTDTAFRSVDGGWAKWGRWGSCSNKCGGGARSRTRTCSEPAPLGSGHDCRGHGKEQEDCNPHTCQAEWSCWSGWEECSSSCGSGVQHRVRVCDSIEGQEPCKGARVESTPCNLGQCTQDGYGEWSAWTACSDLGVSVRIRPCLSTAFCGSLPDAQMRQCDHNQLVDAQIARPVEQGSLSLVLGVVGAFGAGIAVTLCLMCYAVRSRGLCGLGKTSAPPSSVGSSADSELKHGTVMNIYSGPPLNAADLEEARLTMNPLLSSASTSPGLPPDTPYDVYGDIDGNHTLRRTLRTSLKDRDYL